MVVPFGVNLVKPLPSAPTTNRSCGALSLVSFLASGRKNRSLEPSGEDWIGKSARVPASVSLIRPPPSEDRRE